MTVTLPKIIEAKTAMGDWPALAGFTLVTKPATKRLVLSGWGGEKTGKTSFGLSFPKPILDLNLDWGIDELFITRPELLGHVMKKDLEMNELTDPATWGQLLIDFHEAYIQALEYANKHSGTVMVDTATQLWQIIQTVKVEQVRAARIENAERRTTGKKQSEIDEAIERASKPSQMDYGQANAFMGGLCRRALHYPNVNAYFINRAKPSYTRAGQPIPGEMEYHGFGEMPAITQAHLQLYKKGVGPEAQHFARIMKCRFDSALEGIDIMNPTYEVIRDFMLGAAEGA